NKYGTPDDIPGLLNGESSAQTLKLSWQINNHHKLIGLFARSPFTESEFNGGRFVPFESTMPVTEIPRQAKLEWQGTLSDRLLINLMYANAGYKVFYQIQQGSENKPSHYDIATGFFTGAATNILSRSPFRQQLVGRLDFLPEHSMLGSHELSAGYRL